VGYHRNRVLAARGRHLGQTRNTPCVDTEFTIITQVFLNIVWTREKEKHWSKSSTVWSQQTANDGHELVAPQHPTVLTPVQRLSNSGHSLKDVADTFLPTSITLLNLVF